MSFVLNVVFLVLLGLAVRILSHRIFKQNPWGATAAKALTWSLGSLFILTFLLSGLGLYLGQWDFGPYEGTDWALNSGIPGVRIQRDTIVDILVAIHFLLYPFFFFAGVLVAESTGGLATPSIREPEDLDRGRSIIALADTHLGLAPNALERIWQGGMEASATLVLGFLRWLASGGSATIKVWRNGAVHERKLLPPKFVVLCGDILEMWDAPDESSQFAMSTMFPALREIPAESVYVIGNHDSLLARDRTTDPAGERQVRIVPDVWPGPDTTNPLDPAGAGMRPIRAGKRQYLFLHGHQFDRTFQMLGPWSLVPGHLRRAARLGHYGWIFAILFGVTLMIWLLGGSPGAGFAWPILAIAMLLLGVPIFYLVGGRYLWRKLGGGRYRAEAAFRGFYRWWRSRAGGGRFRRGVSPGHWDLVVVYGHTHMADRIDRRSWVDEEGTWPRLPLLLNIPSWIKDPGKEQERALFLYVDAAEPLLLGWDWSARRPFHVPDELLVARRDESKPDLEEQLRRAGMKEEHLRELEWPLGFMEKWGRVELRGYKPPRVLRPPPAKTPPVP